MQGSALWGQGSPRLLEATHALPAQRSILVVSAHTGTTGESRRDPGWPVLPAAKPRADGRWGGGGMVINDSCIKKKQLHLLTCVGTSTLPRPRANGLRLGVPCPLGPSLAVPTPTVRCPIKCKEWLSLSGAKINFSLSENVMAPPPPPTDPGAQLAGQFRDSLWEQGEGGLSEWAGQTLAQ